MLHNGVVSPQSYTYKSYEKEKRLEYDNQILKSIKKIKTTWNIVNIESGRKVKKM